MSSEVSICNLALGRIGISTLIESLDDPNTNSRTCKNLYAEIRDQVLEDFPWDFAQKVAALAVVDDEYSLGYGYRYRYPSDCLRAQVLTDETGGRWPGPVSPIWSYELFPRERLIPFKVMADPDSPPAKLILTDIPEVYLWYTARVTDPNQFSALFRSAFAWKLAAELALPLRAERGFAADAANAYLAEVSRAQVLSLTQGQADRRNIESESIIARLG